MIIISSCQNKVVSIKKCNKVVCAIVHTFAYVKTIECNNGVSSSIGSACSSSLELCKKIRHLCTEQNPCLQQGRNYMIRPCCTDATICKIKVLGVINLAGEGQIFMTFELTI